MNNWGYRGTDGLSDLSKAKDEAKCAVCGLPALTVAPIGGKLIGGCAKHPEQVAAAMRQASAKSEVKRQQKRDLYNEHCARETASARINIMKPYRKKTF